jgi:hypothetical protein
VYTSCLGGANLHPLLRVVLSVPLSGGGSEGTPVANRMRDDDYEVSPKRSSKKANEASNPNKHIILSSNPSGKPDNFLCS